MYAYILVINNVDYVVVVVVVVVVRLWLIVFV